MTQESETKVGRWLDHVDELNSTLERIKALSNALFCVTWGHFEFFKLDDAPTQETLPLSQLAMELCDKAKDHADALHEHLRKLKGCDDLTPAQEGEKHLSQKKKDLLAEVVAFLREATPEMEADLSQRVAGIKQQMKTRREE